jgi:MFS family permease
LWLWEAWREGHAVAGPLRAEGLGAGSHLARQCLLAAPCRWATRCAVGVEATGKQGGAGASLVRALRHRNFRLFFAGQLVSLVGTWMQSVAQSWLVYRLTGSSLLLGVVGFAGQFPVFLLAPLGGEVADRFPRRTVLVATQTAAMILALALAALTLAGLVRWEHVLVLGALLGVVNAFDFPARQSFVVEMVGKDDLSNAIALNSSMVNGARIAGPAVAGVLVGVLGEGFCFLGNGASFLAVIGCLLAMRLPPRGPAPPRPPALVAIVEGFRFVAHTPVVRALLLMVGLASLTAMPCTVLMPIFAGEVLHGGAQSLGVLMGASGVGALIGALGLASRTGLRGLGGWIAGTSAGLGVSLMLFAVSRSLPLSCALRVPAGLCMMVQLAGCNTLVQAMVPDALRGRVMSVYAMMFVGMAPIGALLSGALAQRIGAPATVLASGVACLTGAVVFAMRLPSLRAEARELLAERRAEATSGPA